MHDDEVDERVQDAVALDEIGLYTEVLGAVAASERRLTDAELDAVLGLCHQAEAGPGQRATA